MMPASAVNAGVILPPRLFAQAGWYAAALAAGGATVDTSMPYDKRAKGVHRYDVADTRGLLQLTVPVTRPHRAAEGERTLWHHADVSAHGEWWHVHRTALESAYGRTPYFEFVIDRFAPLLSADTVGMSVPDLARRADEAVRRFLNFPVEVCWRPAAEAPAVATDLRRAVFDTPGMQPYWQVRQAELGFIPSLSILDLIFSLGPEAILYLGEMAAGMRRG